MERVQKTAMRVMLGRRYTTYKNGLQMIKIEHLNERRKKICLKFAKNCLVNEKVKDIFPLNKPRHRMKTRTKKKFKVKNIRTEHYKRSDITLIYILTP